MLQLNKLRITPSPNPSRQYHRAADVAMEEERPVAGPSHAVWASGQDDREMGSQVVSPDAALNTMSEVENGDESGSVLTKEEEAEQPRMVMPRIMQSPASGIEDEYDLDSFAMAIDKADKELDNYHHHNWETLL
jgi:hypothetical protein